MFSWGEDWQQGFRLKNAPAVPTGDGVHFLNLSFHVTDVSAGRSALCFVKSSGEAFIIRTNVDKDGTRGRGKQKFVKEKVEAVSCGDDAVALLWDRGTVFCVDTTHAPFTPRTPEVLCNIQVSQVACGSQHTVALTKDGQVYTWGQDSRGQLGLGKTKSGSGSPQHLRSLSGIPVVRVSAGGEQSFALSVSGGVFGWGRNDCGQLGLGDTEDRHTPAPVHYLNMKKIVHVSCGKEHTAALTKDGAVFTFGSGRYGQLGHNSLRDELRPRLVAELWGAKVIQVACGRHHTLVLTDTRKVHSFGCDEQGQLGRKEESHPSVPLPVQLPQDAVIQSIFAGGNSSFATCSPNEGVHKGSNSGTKNSTTQQSIDNMIDRWTSGCDSWKKTKQEIHRMFSSASCMNRSFLDQSNEKHFQTSARYSGLDLSLAQRDLEKLVKSDVVLAEVEAALQKLLPSLERNPVGVEGLRIFPLLYEFLHVMQKHRGPRSMTHAEAIAAAVQTLSAESRQIIGDWWSSLSPSFMVRYVKVWKNTLAAILYCYPVPLNSIRNILLILQDMYNANKNKKTPETTFCTDIYQVFLEEDLQRWRAMAKSKHVTDPPLLLCDFPFVMNLQSKKMVFDIGASWTQMEHQTPPPGCIPQQKPYYFELNLKRASLVADTFVHLFPADQKSLKKPLVVYFDEDTKITDVYKRDFFHHVFHDMVSPNFGMFMFNDSKTLAWFPSTQATEDEERTFYQFGVLCGLALYNQSVIYLPFPLVLFKKLLNVEPTLDDLMEFSPSVGQSLQHVLNYDDDVLEGLYMDFLINWNGTEVDLDPQNPGALVTSQNKKQFVDAYVDHAFNSSVEAVFREFERGFFQVCDRDLVKLFGPEELQKVLVGRDEYDWAKFRQNTVYEWVYHLQHPTIQMFWEVFTELTEDQKKDFLWFVTGFRKAPILGLGQIQMRVRVKYIQSGSYDQHFPESLTCHAILELPVYSTKEVMRDRLTEAVIPERGFWK